MNDCKLHKTIRWIFQILAAAILIQTLYFKFTGAPESKFIFSTLGVEPWGRYATGVLELIASALLLWPRGAVYGGLLSMGLMSGALFSHVTSLGIVVQGDGGLLFALAVIVLGASAIVVWLGRQELPYVGPLLARLGGNSCAWSPERR